MSDLCVVGGGTCIGSRIHLKQSLYPVGMMGDAAFGVAGTLYGWLLQLVLRAVVRHCDRFFSLSSLARPLPFAFILYFVCFLGIPTKLKFPSSVDGYGDDARCLLFILSLRAAHPSGTDSMQGVG